ncbi:MAG: GerAB/ArcD/ProY family transporter [Clostridia bacterium]|jgi:spore germination protein KB|nr:GerAB/ArcD/ProY family transporter [Clostridia bacterium]
MVKQKISTISAIMLTLSIVVSYITSSLPRTFINESKSAAILNIVYITAIVLFIILLFCKLLKKFPGLDLLDISNFLGGNILKNIVGGFFIFYFILSSSLMLRNFCEGLSVVYYPLTSYVFVILMFIIALAISNRLGFISTLNTASIIFPLVLISAILLFCGNLDNFSFRRIYPILGDGFYNTFILGLKNIGSFGGICYLYFLPPMLKEPEKLKKIAIISVICTGAFILLCVATLLFMFSFFITTNEVMPLFSAARYIEFGSFFQRFESIFLLIWIISFCCYLSISCKFATHIFSKMFNLSDMKPLLTIFTILILGISLLPKNYAVSSSFETDFYRYLRIAIGYILGMLILILANLKKKKVGEKN